MRAGYSMRFVCSRIKRKAAYLLLLVMSNIAAGDTPPSDEAPIFDDEKILRALKARRIFRGALAGGAAAGVTAQSHPHGGGHDYRDFARGRCHFFHGRAFS